MQHLEGPMQSFDAARDCDSNTKISFQNLESSSILGHNDEHGKSMPVKLNLARLFRLSGASTRQIKDVVETHLLAGEAV